MRSGVEQRALRDDIHEGRRRAFDAERVSIGPAESRTDDQLRYEVIAEFPVGGKAALYVGIRNRRTRAVRERQPDGALERQRFSLAARRENQYGRSEEHT